MRNVTPETIHQVAEATHKIVTGVAALATIWTAHKDGRHAPTPAIAPKEGPRP